MVHRTIGGILIIAGLALTMVGLLAWAGALSWFGRLRGDIRIEREQVRIYVPIMSLIIVNVVVMGIIWVARKLF